MFQVQWCNYFVNKHCPSLKNPVEILSKILSHIKSLTEVFLNVYVCHNVDHYFRIINKNNFTSIHPKLFYRMNALERL